MEKVIKKYCWLPIKFGGRYFWLTTIEVIYKFVNNSYIPIKLFNKNSITYHFDNLIKYKNSIQLNKNKYIK